MNIIVVDPNAEERKCLSEILQELYGVSRITCFGDPLLAFKFGAINQVDALYTVSEMNRLSGFELGKMLREMHPDIELHLIADDDRGKKDAMRIMADSYIKRPITAEALKTAENAEW